jgi:hypothetical protein
VEEIGGSSKGFSAKLLGKMDVEHRSVHSVVNGMNSVLDLAILLGGVWAKRCKTVP